MWWWCTVFRITILKDDSGIQENPFKICNTLRKLVNYAIVPCHVACKEGGHNLALSQKSSASPDDGLWHIWHREVLPNPSTLMATPSTPPFASPPEESSRTWKERDSPSSNRPSHRSGISSSMRCRWWVDRCLCHTFPHHSQEVFGEIMASFLLHH